MKTLFKWAGISACLVMAAQLSAHAGNDKTPQFEYELIGTQGTQSDFLLEVTSASQLGAYFAVGAIAGDGLLDASPRGFEDSTSLANRIVTPQGVVIPVPESATFGIAAGLLLIPLASRRLLRRTV